MFKQALCSQSEATHWIIAYPSPDKCHIEWYMFNGVIQMQKKQKHDIQQM